MKRIIMIGLTVLLLFAPRTSRVSEQNATDARTLFEYFYHTDSGEISFQDLLEEKYYYLLDEKGRELTVTGRRIHVGDEYVTSDNRLYRVHSVRDKIAQARFIRRVGAVFEDDVRSFPVALWESIRQAVLPVQAPGNLLPQGEPKRIVAVYHTHNAESFVPTDGTHSIFGRGGIHEVGDSFTYALEAKDVTVLFDQTKHLPHDRGAYRRSRATAERLLAKGPDVMFDIHRDAAPRHVYAGEVDGRPIARVQFVVGRQNPNMRINRQLALDLKKTADEIHPGLVKGIFMARGNYNQDLTPMNLLLETGAHTNSREAAEDGVALFADVVYHYFYGADDKAARPELFREDRTPPGADPRRGGRAALRHIGYLGLSVLLIAAGFLFINAGPVKNIQNKLVPHIKKIEPYTAKSDVFLMMIRENIRKGAIVAGAAVSSAVGTGDRLLEKIRDRIFAAIEKRRKLR